jgi:hypothetical protein
MQRKRRARPFAEPQMRGVQRLAALRGERRRPRERRAGKCRAGRARGGARLPSRTANDVRGGGVSMAQRFFSGSGTTPFTSCNPAGSGGR